MKYLLDTQVFLWSFLHPKKIPGKVWALVEDPDRELYLSAASAWEIAIKVRLGKLEIPADPGLYVSRRTRESNISSLSITQEHALAAGGLPLHHRDPFDRMLVAQAQLENLTLVTADEEFAKYGVRCLTI